MIRYDLGKLDRHELLVGFGLFCKHGEDVLTHSLP
jgi:hypothetical protein